MLLANTMMQYQAFDIRAKPVRPGTYYIFIASDVFLSC